MEQYLEKVPAVVQMISMILMSLTILATVVVRLAPHKIDDDKLTKFAGTLIKVLNWMPTIGLNPKTKELQQAYEALRAGSTVTTTTVDAVQVTATEVKPDDSVKTTP